MAVIQELDKETINKIAAGEVIQCPASALKEILENSIDAGSTYISINIQGGGYEVLSISDNGKGIHPADFPVLCKRFTTSKLQDYSDLQHLTTFGFRGEALSSVSQVARTTISSRKQEMNIGYSGVFRAGELLAQSVPIRKEQGTLVLVEGMFDTEEMKMRKRDALQEYKKCWETVCFYAVHFPNVLFTLTNNHNKDFSSSSQNDRISTIIDIIKEPLFRNQHIGIPVIKFEDYEYFGIVSKITYNSKKALFIFFVNNRLVGLKELKNLLIGVYSDFTCSSHVFVYIAITVPPASVDVNIHPNKREVIIRGQERLFNEIQASLRKLLMKTQNSSTFIVKTIKEPTKPTQGVNPSQTVRVSSRDTQLTWYTAPKPIIEKRVPQENLRSVDLLKSEINQGSSQDIFDDFVYVGSVDTERILIQHKTGLYLCLVPVILQEVNYQYILNHIGGMDYYEIDGEIAIPSLIEIGLNDPELNASIDGPSITEHILTVLDNKTELLSEYFSIRIENGMLVGLPLVLDGKVQPLIDNLPQFIIKLVYETDWSKEKACLDGISRVLAWFYSHVPKEWNIGAETIGYEEIYRTSLIPYIRGRLIADPRFIQEGTALISLVTTESLYKVFERC